MNNLLVWSGSLLAFLLYYPLIVGIVRDEIEQSFATWMLWVALDAIALASVLAQKGNFLLLACYCVCGTVVVTVLVCKKQFKWTWFETLVLALVIFCLVIWCLSGSRMATVSSTIAVFISGCPQVRDSWRKPDRKTGCIYLGYSLANGLSFMGGRGWTIEERFYPALTTLLCLVIAGAALVGRQKSTR